MKLADCVLEVETQLSKYESWSGVIETVARYKAHWESRRKDRKIEVTQRGIVQDGYSEDDLPWDMVNYKRVFKPNVDIEKFM